MEKQLPNHDHYFRKMMSDLAHAKDFLRKYLPGHLQSIINFRSLRLCKESYIGKDLSEKVTDILYSVNIQQKKGYIYILVEHQSTPEVLLPFRIQEYIFCIMDQHLKQTDKKILPVIVPLVFYNGQKNYPYSTDIFDLFGDHKKLAEEFLFKPFQLIDLSKISNDELRKHTSLWLMEFVMKNIKARDFLPYIEMIASELRSIEQKMGPDYIIATIGYIIKAGNIADPQAFKEIVNKSLSEETGEKLMTLAEYWIQQGMKEGVQQGLQQGRERGIQEGRQEEAYYVARNLILRGMSNAEISAITGLPIQEIAHLKVSETEIG